MIDEIKNIFRPTVHKIRENRIVVAASKAESHYQNVIEKIRQSGRTRLRFAAYVVFDSTFGMNGVFVKMMNTPERWNPKVVVIPDISRGPEHAKKTYKKTKEFFVNKFGSNYVLDGWNPESNEFFDYLDRFDIVYYANPYDSMVHKYHSIMYSTTKNVLPIYVSYGYDIGRYTTIARLKEPELNIAWKVFTDTTYSYHDYQTYQLVKGKNVVLAGYSKMDNLNVHSSKDNKHKAKELLEYGLNCLESLNSRVADLLKERINNRLNSL